MKRFILLFLILAGPVFGADAPARNVILFLGDAGGIPTLSVASIHGYNEPRRLFIQNMPNIALAETSSASRWVTDSAAGMTAVVTGRKTHNGVLAQSDTAVRGSKDGEPLKTILEYAEERGLSTGVVSNSSVLSATPAACYAHVNDRKKEGEVFLELLKPRFGDGVDVVIGEGRKNVMLAAQQVGLDAVSALSKAGLKLYPSLDSIPAEVRRAVVLFDGDFDLDVATRRAIDVLSRNPKGFFLMVESDLHTEKLRQGLDRAVALDRVIRRTAERMKSHNTLVLYTADHSYDLRINGGARGQPLFPSSTAPEFGDNLDSILLGPLRRDDDHTGEEVLVAAQGPGAERVRGFLSNTDLFHIMMSAFGWK
ncbi:MAG TPA: alkaline phosphatase [Acidobacteriota bacterium]|jgi:alkaline phosphatase